MTSQLARDTHGVEIPYDDGAINASGGEEVALAVEAQRCRVAGADRIGDVFRVVLKQVVVREEVVHLVAVLRTILRGCSGWESSRSRRHIGMYDLPGRTMSRQCLWKLESCEHMLSDRSAARLKRFSGLVEPCDAISRDMGPLPTEIVGEDRGPRFILPPLHKVLTVQYKVLLAVERRGVEFSPLAFLPEETLSIKCLHDTFQSQRLLASSDRRCARREHGQLKVRFFLFFIETQHERAPPSDSSARRWEYVKQFEQPDQLLPNTWIVVRIDGRGFTK